MPTFLPRSSRPTTALGLGCAYMTGGFEERHNAQLVRAAFDGGIRHFDVAPTYGNGMAEAVLGRALAGDRDRCTIATKVGFRRPAVSKAKLAIRGLATPIRNTFPSLTRRIPAAMAAAPAERIYTVPFVDASLTESLRNLRTDYIDLFLLHEARPEDLTDELLAYLDRKRSEGVIRATGIASSVKTALAVGERFDAVQHAWSVLDPHPLMSGVCSLTHRSMNPALNKIRSWAVRNPEGAKAFERGTGVAPADSQALADALITSALIANATGVVLASSRNLKRVQRIASLSSFESAGLKSGVLTDFLSENLGFREQIVREAAI